MMATAVPTEVSLEPEIKEIKKLDEVVVNRIAAGEIIHRPANALKELIENSLDAKSKSISVTVKNGGIKLLQIQDTGHGIRRSDLSIVCERFTTSKLTEFEDLKKISTFGFRGEALASISHVAHLTITTRTKDEECAFKASYCDGKLKASKPGQSADPKPCAGNVGTTISVEDLFYNMNTRRKALTKVSDEHTRIYEVVSRYSINYPNVAFSLKKQGETGADLRTVVNSTSKDNVKLVFGQKVAKELLELEKCDDRLHIKVSGLVSNANYSVKRGTFIFFINGRLVDCSVLKKAIDDVYSAYLPKHTHPFIYLSLLMPPMNVDVNVHPTKQEVHFLHELRIVELVQEFLEERLVNANSSRTFYTQSLLTTTENMQAKNDENDKRKQKVYDHQLVRTDFRTQTLHAFTKSQDNNKRQYEEKSKDEVEDNLKPTVKRRKRNPVHLTSIEKCKSEFLERECFEAKEIFQKHSFVGCVNRSLALFQYQTKLYLVNVKTLSQELFYQLAFEEFANFGVYEITSPVNILQLLDIALDSDESGFSEEEHGSKESLLTPMFSEVMSKSEMLREYFMIEISEDGVLTGMPILLEHYIPDWSKLPMFFLRVATEVEWDSEINCFQTLAFEISRFYTWEGMEQILDNLQKNNDDDDEVNRESKNTDTNNLPWIIEHVLFPAFKRKLKPSRAVLDNKTLLPVANLHDLYKVFERC